MAGTLSAFRKYLFPGILANVSNATMVSKAAPDSMSHYARAIRSMLDDIKTPVSWAPGGSTGNMVDLQKQSPDDLIRILREQSSMDPTTTMLTAQKGLAGDVVMDHIAANIAKNDTIAGRMGEGTAPVLMHELGHVRDMQRNPLTNYMHALAQESSALPDALDIAGGRGFLSPSMAFNASRAPTFLGELNANLSAHRALGSVDVPLPVKLDMWKRLGPAMGTYMFPAPFTAS